MPKGAWITIVSALTLVAAITGDLLTKQSFFGTADNMSSGSFFSGIVERTTHYNYGISFNIPVPTLLLLIVSLLILGGIVILLGRQIYRRSLWSALAISLLLGGAVGNFYDRLALGYVRDWILFFNRSAMNVADFCIILGALGLAWLYHPQAKREEKVIPNA